MILLYALKVTGVMAATAVAELWATGDWQLALLAVPMLLSMRYAIRQHARRRTRAGGLS